MSWEICFTAAEIALIGLSFGAVVWGAPLAVQLFRDIARRRKR